MNPDHKLKVRALYLDKLIAFKDSEAVKIITGIRRCGKSSLLKLMVRYLKSIGIKDDCILEMNFESNDFRSMTCDELYSYVKTKSQKKRIYLFFDEIQRIPEWENAINAFRVDLDCDIYVTGSNAYLLSSEYSTYLSGRCIEIRMLPLSFTEFIDFNELKTKTVKGALGEEKKIVTDENDIQYDLYEVFDAYLRFGGMPAISEMGLNQENAFTLLEGIYSTVVVRDILERDKKRRQITDPVLLKKIIMFLCDNIGSSISATSIGNSLESYGLIEKQKSKPSVHTIQSYIGTLLESYFFYEIKRFDIKGKEYLKTLGKYYVVDTGLRNFLLGIRNRDRGHILENIVFFELQRRGYDVAVGKLDSNEIDFIATSQKEKIYFQVTESMASEDVRERELAPLLRINDNYEKIILSMDKNEDSYEGIKIRNILTWLIQPK